METEHRAQARALAFIVDALPVVDGETLREAATRLLPDEHETQRRRALTHLAADYDPADPWRRIYGAAFWLQKSPATVKAGRCSHYAGNDRGVR